MSLKTCYDCNNDIIEIGIDEVGRGPMFGRVYCAAVVLPRDNTFKHDLMKDSKKFHSKKKIESVSEYIKTNCLYYTIAYEDELSIDKNNIKNATFIAMHKAIKNIISIIANSKINNIDYKNINILVDGCEFKPYTYLDSKEEMIKEIKTSCIIGGDNKYTSIAAASILAKVERDKYIYALCEKYPKLDEYYDLSKNKGYGTAKHLEGIRKYGITNWHRRSFGLCRDSTIFELENEF
jgi:ribonuclease HII